MTDRAGAILDYVGFVKTVLLVAGFAFAIDPFNRDAVAKAVVQHLTKFSISNGAVVTLCAVVREFGVTSRDFAGVKKTFAPATWEQENREQTAKNRQQADDEPCPTPRMKPAIITEIAFVTLGDLLLRASRFRHRLSKRTRSRRRARTRG